MNKPSTPKTADVTPEDHEDLGEHQTNARVVTAWPKGSPRPMNLQRLSTASGDAANSITIRCCVTGRKAHWINAVIEGWYADLNGKPFNDYYSPEAIAKIEFQT